MNDWEQGICSRVKTIRESIKWSQSAFAEQLGINRNQLANIESGRTPLRYEIAWNLRKAFGISLRWLEEGDGFADNLEHDNLPVPSATGLMRRALLSAVAKKHSQFETEDLISIGPVEDSDKERIEFDPNSTKDLFRAVAETLEGKEGTTGVEDIKNRELLESQMRIVLGGWMARIPIGHAYEFTERLNQFAEQFIASLPAESLKAIDRRSDQIMWERIKNSNAKKILIAADLDKKSKKENLTIVSESVNPIAVTPKLPTLLSRLKKASAQRGKKSALAQFLGVSLVQVSQWLSGDREPGGETTLRLLHWVEQQERQK